MRQFLFAAVLVCVLPLTVPANDWVGQWAFPRKNCVPVYDEKRVKKIGEWGITAGEVLKEDGEWVEVSHRQATIPRRGWVRKRDVVKAAEAPAFFTKELKRDEKNPWLYQIRADAWTLTGEHERAIEDLTKAIRLEPGSEIGYFSRGAAYGMKGENEKAIADFTEAIRLNPNCIGAYFNRGMVHYLRGDFAQAVKDFGAAVRLNPKDSQALTSRGMAHSRVGDYENAIKDFAAALELDPQDGVTYCYRGRLYADRGEYEKAASDFREGVRHSPRLRQGLAWYAWLLAACPEEKYRDGKKAVELAKQAVELGRKEEANWFYFATLAAAYAECGEYRNAVEWEKKALKDQTYANAPGTRERLQLYERNEPYRMPRLMQPPRK
jgi:tetratricopeptide (TPR) repeat protein